MTEATAGAKIVMVLETASPVGGTQAVADAVEGELRGLRRVALNCLEPTQEEFRTPPGTELHGRLRLKRHFLTPLYARTMSGAPTDGADLVIVLTGGAGATAVPVRPGGRMLSYFAGPTPALYTRSEHYIATLPALVRPVVRAAMPLYRRYDRRLIRRADRLLVPSAFCREQVLAHYGVDAEVLEPPVRTSFFTPPQEPGHPRIGLLAVSRLVRHKRLHLAIEAARELGEPLTIAGVGPDLKRLRRLAPDWVRFAGYVDDNELRRLYRGARALVHPCVEEFGIVMAEALACGTPVIAPAAGGAREIVNDPLTGSLFAGDTGRAVTESVRTVLSGSLDPAACRRSVLRFSAERFGRRIREVAVEELELAGGVASGLPVTEVMLPPGREAVAR